jgi:hypothetical protein
VEGLHKAGFLFNALRQGKLLIKEDRQYHFSIGLHLFVEDLELSRELPIVNCVLTGHFPPKGVKEVVVLLAILIP